MVAGDELCCLVDSQLGMVLQVLYRASVFTLDLDTLKQLIVSVIWA
jgi:hypothetical protein